MHEGLNLTPSAFVDGAQEKPNYIRRYPCDRNSFLERVLVGRHTGFLNLPDPEFVSVVVALVHRPYFQIHTLSPRQKNDRGTI